MSPPGGERPLGGLRIVSLAEQYPGPFATLILSDLGADVIQVERPRGGDPARAFPALHAALGRGKRSVALDLKDPRARAALTAVLARADVLLEGFRPGVMDRLGLGPDALRAAYPALVYVSISGFGQFGPYRGRPAHDLTYQAMTGHLAESGGDVPPLSLADVASGMFAAIAVLSGLVSRGSGRGGSTLDVAMFDAMVSLLTTTLGPVLDGASGASDLARDPGYGVFTTSDGRRVTLSINLEDKFWDALCRAVPLPRHLGLTGAERIARRDELRAELAAAFASAPLEVWERRLATGDVPYGPVTGHDELADDPHVRARGLIHEVTGRRFVRQPIVVDGRGPGPVSGPPPLGAHTAEVLREAGVDPAVIAELAT